MSGKDKAVFEALSASLGSISETEKSVLAVHAVLVANGYIPKSVSSSGNGGINMLPTADWPSSATYNGIYVLQYFNDIEAKCIPIGNNKLMVHATNGNDLFSLEIDIPIASVDAVIDLVSSSIVRPLQGRSEPQQSQSRLLVTSRPPTEPRRGPSPPGGPRAPPFGQPIGPGELVGPNHPIFTGEGSYGGQERPGGIRDPRFDPIGPGHIGEPDTDHFPPPPFGQPPGRTPLRGPRSNLGPGGMFM